jgi:hypothetical protein
MDEKDYIVISKEDLSHIKITIRMIKKATFDAGDDIMNIEKMIRRLYFDKSIKIKFKKILLKKIFKIDIDTMHDYVTNGFAKIAVIHDLLMWGINDKLEEAIKKDNDEPKNE